MTTEVRPFGVACSLKCKYCYQEPQRVAGNTNASYDLGTIIKEITKSKAKTISFFGGEFFLMPEEDIEVLFRYAYQCIGGSGVQTSGSIMNDRHVEMCKKYNVQVGFSIDGPDELNSLREPRSRAVKTEDMTNNTLKYIEKCVKNGIQVGLIITLHRENATRERMPKLLEFIQWLYDLGIKGGNIHTLEIESTMPNHDFVLTQEENIWAYTELAKFFKGLPDSRWNPFAEIKDLLVGNDRNSLCYWHRCDPLNTQAVYGIEGNGAISNCGRANKEGIDWVKASDNKFSRYIGFYHTPQDMGGCNGCRFWSICGGSCPGESDQGDFRNKTTHCSTQKAILTHYEEELVSEGIEPLTLSPKLGYVEKVLLQGLHRGENYLLNEILTGMEETKTTMLQLPVIKEVI